MNGGGIDHSASLPSLTFKLPSRPCQGIRHSLSLITNMIHYNANRGSHTWSMLNTHVIRDSLIVPYNGVSRTKSKDCDCGTLTFAHTEQDSAHRFRAIKCTNDNGSSYLARGAGHANMSVLPFWPDRMSELAYQPASVLRFGSDVVAKSVEICGNYMSG